MVDIRTAIAKVDEHDGYIIEVRHPDDFTDEVTEALDENFEQMGATIGDGNAYVRFTDRDADEELINKLDRSVDLHSMPWLILLDKHPDVVESGDECLIMELGKLESKREVVIALRKAREALNNKRFMRRLSIEQRVEWLRDALSPLESGAQFVITSAPFVL